MYFQSLFKKGYITAFGAHDQLSTIFHLGISIPYLTYGYNIKSTKHAKFLAILLTFNQMLKILEFCTYWYTAHPDKFSI